MSLTSYRAAPPRVPGRGLYLNLFLLSKRKLCRRRFSSALVTAAPHADFQNGHFSWITLHNFHFQLEAFLTSLPPSLINRY
jgi:hypothetical protein